jgi:preprotein translocase subunit SecF
MFLNRFDYKIDFMGKRHIAVWFSALFMLVSIASLAIQGLVFGLDFTGGTLVEVGYTQSVELDDIRKTLHENGFPEAVVQHFGTTSDVSIRLGIHEKTQDEENQNEALSTIILRLLEQQSGDKVEMRRVEYVGPQIGGELVEKGGLAVLLTLFGILIYVWFRFEYRFALGSIAALIHDTVIVVGIFSLFRLEFDLTVLAAVLAVIGYSLNDTIVVFDRIRENFVKLRKQESIKVVNISINQMLGRTVMTSVTTALVLIVLFTIGGELIHGFSTALLIGVVVGTYSSIYIASASALALGVTKADLMPVQKEGAEEKNEHLW